MIATRIAIRPTREREIAPPVDADPLGRLPRLVVQRAVADPRAPDTDGDADPEHRAPVPLRQHAADHEAGEGAGQRGDLVHAECESASLGRERVGDDRRRVGGQHRAADALHDAHRDDLQRAGRPGVGHEGTRDRSDGEDQESQVEQARATVLVTESPERDDQHGGHEQVAHQHPQQVRDVLRRQRVQAQAVEDGGQRDQQDRRIEGRGEHADGGHDEGDAAVVSEGVIHELETFLSLAMLTKSTCDHQASRRGVGHFTRIDA